MITKLESPLRREISIDGRPYVVTISPTGLLLTEKGRRKGFAMDWAPFVSGEVALAKALNASLANAPRNRRSEPTTSARQAPRPAARSAASGARTRGGRTESP